MMMRSMDAAGKLVNRRGFLKAGLIGAGSALVPRTGFGRAPRRVSLVIDPQDAVVCAAPVARAVGELERALCDAGADVRRVTTLGDTGPADRIVVVSSHAGTPARSAMRGSGLSLDGGVERLALVSDRAHGCDALIACATDPRGLTYAVTELVERVRGEEDPIDALAQASPLVQRPLNPVRSVMRQFTSQALDTAWYHDREMWPAYLSMLAASRFNRLHLAFGLGYDTLQSVTDSYLLFLYPFLVDVPGYGVRVTNLDAAERERNLETLRFISEQTVAHGLTFQLGVWMHGYELLNSPQARYRVEGLTPASHAGYCRDALTTVLRACPAISAVALRIHGESGIKEGSYEFWQTVFDGVRRAGRTIEIDLHAKGIDNEMIDRALATGMPVNVSPKYWAEHLGLPYHQAEIRALERPVAGRIGAGLMTLSEGARSFTRYGYADLMREDRRYTVRFRVFSGTQRILASGDPAAAAAHARAFTFCGATGMDLMEPLTCRGRRGSGVAGTPRSGYADASLDTRWDWEKFALWYRTWGHAAYDPATDAAVALRPLGRDTARVAPSLARASRVLPLVTTAHLPSAACDAYWPEIYWNQPIVGEPRPNPYGDTTPPKTFVHVSPLDPELFAGIAEHADDLLNGRVSAKYSPVAVASRLESLVSGIAIDASALRSRDAGTRRLMRDADTRRLMRDADTRRLMRDADSRRLMRDADTRRLMRDADTRRLMIDMRIQAGLGRFFAAKLRAGVLYAIYERTGARAALDAAAARYRDARDAWAGIVDIARGVYAADLSASDRFSERGQWADRLAAIDEDVARMAASAVADAHHPRAAEAVAHAAATIEPIAIRCRHTPPTRAVAGRALDVMLSPQDTATVGVGLRYRHVNQAERFEEAPMTATSGSWRGAIPSAYTDSPYPLQYYFVVSLRDGRQVLYPGLGAEWLGTPYLVVRK